MKELIKISDNNGNHTISAKELYLFLGYDSANWKRWYERNIVNNEFAIENDDWEGFFIKKSGNETKDFALTIDFAKKLAMTAHTEKGEQARQYFLDVEKAYKGQIAPHPHAAPSQFKVPSNFKEALLQLVENIEYTEQLEGQLKKQQPKVEIYDAVMSTDGSIYIRECAKILCQRGKKIGQRRLFEVLRFQKILMSTNEPYQNYIDNGYFEFKLGSYVHSRTGETILTKTTMVTPKGVEYIYKRLSYPSEPILYNFNFQ